MICGIFVAFWYQVFGNSRLAMCFNLYKKFANLILMDTRYSAKTLMQNRRSNPDKDFRVELLKFNNVRCNLVDTLPTWYVVNLENLTSKSSPSLCLAYAYAFTF